MRTLLAPLACLLLTCGLARAEIYHTADGKQIEGALIGEQAGTLSIFTTEGETVTVARADLIRVDTSHQVDAMLRKRAARARKQLIQDQQREVKKLLKEHGRARTDAERDAIVKSLAGFNPGILVGPLGDALRDTKPSTRALAVGRLRGIGGERAVGELLRATLTTKHDDLQDSAHQAAIAADRDLSRRSYEAVAASQTKPGRRMRALANVAAMGDDAAVPGLVRVIEHVDAEIQATLATAGNLRRVPVSLGTTGGTALNVDIELPELELISVQTTAKVPVTVLREIRAAAVRGLRAVTEDDLGDDPEAWKKWWERRNAPR